MNELGYIESNIRKMQEAKAEQNATMENQLDYGPEGAIDLAWGGQLRFPTYEWEHGGASYVRIVDAEGNELVYWNADEWEEDPRLVMGAIMGAAQNGVKP